MVQASTHMGISVSMHGWAFLLGHKTIVALHHLPLPHLPPNVHHPHLPLCITLLPDGKKSSRGLLGLLKGIGDPFFKDAGR
jgi:hypothetical protein